LRNRLTQQTTNAADHTDATGAIKIDAIAVVLRELQVNSAGISWNCYF
jgi:hypothetical protein